MIVIVIMIMVMIMMVLCSKDVRLPIQLQRAMAAEAEATREARAKVEIQELWWWGQWWWKWHWWLWQWPWEQRPWIVSNVSQVIAAEGENSAAQALRNASEVEQFFKTNAKSRICHQFLKLPQVISGSPAAMQLRYLQVRYFPFLPSFEAISSYLDFLFTNIWQTLNAISQEKNSTIIFPVPVDLISSFNSR